MDRTEVLLIGGRAGVGKSTVGWEVSARLRAASDVTAGERLAGRELGSEREEGLKASAYKARLLDQQVSADAVRVVTDGRPVVDIAREVVAATGWVR
jgi:2-phosphoglycerate kinase